MNQKNELTGQEELVMRDEIYNLLAPHFKQVQKNGLYFKLACQEATGEVTTYLRKKLNEERLFKAQVKVVEEETKALEALRALARSFKD